MHLTDLHYGLAGQRPLWPNVREAFFADLRKLHKRCGPWQAVLFTGDLVQAGREEEFKSIESEVLARLWKELEALGSGDARLLAVPGNHDLVRPEASRPSAAVRQLLRPGGLAEIAEEFWTDPGSEYRSVIGAALANYDAWWGRTVFRRNAAVTSGILPGDFAATLPASTRRIGVIGLNTTFLQLAAGDYRERLAWDIRQLQSVCTDMADWRAGHEACLLLTHQGPDWLDAHSREAYAEINPAGRFAVHLFGHMHETVVRSTRQGGGKPLRQWQGCSLFGLERFGDPPRQDRRHGYGAGCLEFGTRQTVIRHWPRRAVKDANGWRFVPDEETCVLTSDGGTEPEEIGSEKKPASARPRRRTPPALAAPAASRESALVATYTKAARALWDIIDLAGLPEDERHLAMQRFMLRQLYLPLRMVVESAPDEGALAALEENRELRRFAAAGRLSAPAGEAVEHKPGKRESLGGWLGSAMAVAPRGKIKKNRKDEDFAPRLVLLGDPGGGKTTLLRWLATAYLLRREKDSDLVRLPDADSLPATDWLPILIRCRELDREGLGQCALEDLLRQTVARMELPGGQIDALVELLRARLEAGSAILLVDGLDEITDPARRAAFCGRLEGMAKRFYRSPIIATSRIVGYREMRRRLGQGFAHATLAELTPEEKDDFVRRWCEVTILEPVRRAAEAEKLQRGIHGSDRIERLTTNPMLLTTMALVQRKVGKLPTRRHKLYWEAVGVLLNWRAEVEEPMDPDEALPQLEYVAYTMCDRGVQRLRRDELLGLLEGARRDYPNIRPLHRLTPEAFLAGLERRTGLLVEVGEVQHEGRPVAVYEFRHLTFQEYLGARAILEGRFSGHQSGTTLAQRIKPLAGRLAEIFTGPQPELQVTENWREALRLCVASCSDDDVDPVLEAILEPERTEEARPRATLALLCLADEPNVTHARAAEILRRFAEQIRGEDSSISWSSVARAAQETAGGAWGPPLQEALAAEFLRCGPRLRVNPGSVCGNVGHAAMPRDRAGQEAWWNRQIEALISPSEQEAVSAALAIMLAAYFRTLLGSPRAVVDGLMQLLGRSPAASHAASWALGWLSGAFDHKAYWKPSAKDTSRLLAYLANPTFDPQALRWLLIICGAARIREALFHCTSFLHHPEADVRIAAAEALGRIGDPAADEGLRRALKDVDAEVRGVSLGALVELSNYPDARLRSKLVSFHLIDRERRCIDPEEPISIERVNQASQRLSLSAEQVRSAYETLADDYGLRLEWRP
ncbi:MAG TPA: NACHT domain-containing protein [Thermoanaerobaculia bacterium]|nr:NACHT domain-containing protein [Thermoanaerobaculia bacterium]